MHPGKYANSPDQASKSLEIIGAGFGRTGTRSTKAALELLGFGPCHHMIEVFNSPRQLAAWEKAVFGQAVNFSEILDGYRAAIDWPSTHYWRMLANEFPTAKVILTVRAPNAWWSSFSATIKRLLEIRDRIPNPEVRSVLRMAHEMIANQTFGGVIEKQSAMAAYEARIQDVKNSIAPDRLLEFNVADGWAPLCQFLGTAVPTCPFPRGNSREEFWNEFGGGISVCSTDGIN